MRQPGKIAIWVFGIVFLAVVILQSGRYSYVQDNGTSNFGPSGTSAFLELLKRSKYSVTLDATTSPKITKTMVIPVSQSNLQSFQKFLKAIKPTETTTIVALIIPLADTKKTDPKPVENAWDQKQIGQVQPFESKSTDWKKPLIEAQSMDLLTLNDGYTAVVKVINKKKLRIIHLPEAAFVTNAYIDKVDNANIAMGLIELMAKQGQAITYVDSFASRDIDDSLLAKMGVPFQAAWNQLILLIVVIFTTLSIRFGLAPESRASQRGGRELVDGLATMTRRKKNARWALRAVFDRVLAELERRHRVSREQIIQRPDRFMNSDDAMKLKEIEAATFADIDEREAIARAKELKRLV